MSSRVVQDKINKQITIELHAAYLYLAMAAYFEEENLAGFAHWMREQHREEHGHALRLFDFLLNSGGHVQLDGVAAPKFSVDGPLSVMEQALAHEQKVTASITELYELARSEKDYPAELELQWFITEQVEEERTVGDIVAKLQRVGDNQPALLMIDRELGTRSGS